MPLIKKRSAILAKIESVYGTDPTPDTSDGVLVEELSPGQTTEYIERNPVKGTYGSLPGLIGRNIGTLSFQCELKGSGAAGTAPEYGVLLRSCGMGETIVPATSVTYAPVSTGFESCTIYAYMDGKLRKYTGCRGTYTIDMSVGQRAMITFNMTGTYEESDAALVSPTLDATTPVKLTSAAFSFESYSAVVSSVSIDAGMEVITPDNINSSSGYGEVSIVNRAMTGSCDPEQTLVATRDWQTKFLAGTESALAILACNGSAGNICNITAPICVATDLQDGDRDGIMTYDLPFSMNENTGDDEISIAFT